MSPMEDAIVSEVELKLSADPERLPNLRHCLETMEKASPQPGATLASTYYDSADQRLHRRGLSLRLRQSDGQWIQTLKSADPPELLSRGEWEDVVAADRPDFDAPTTGPRLREVIGAEALQPLFSTVVERTIVMLDPAAGVRIEAAIDAGEIRHATGEAFEPISEIELELKSGDASALYDLAMRLLEIAPLRIQTLSKADRGYGVIA